MVPYWPVEVKDSVRIRPVANRLSEACGAIAMNSIARLASVSLIATACCTPQPSVVEGESARFASGSALETGPGSITGRATLVGAAPDPRRIILSPGCAALNGRGTVPDPGALVYQEHGNAVPYAFVYIRDGVPTGRPPPTKPVTLTYERCRIEPRVLGMIAGQPLMIRNRDNLPHNFHSLARKNRSFNFAQPTVGAKLISGDRSFSRPEFGADAMRVKCDIHPWETAWCHVMPHGFFDVSRSHETDGGDPSRRGTFEIRDVPPGEYVVVAWHESFGMIEQTIVVRPGIATDVQFGFDPDRSGPARTPEAAPTNGLAPWRDDWFLLMAGLMKGRAGMEPVPSSTWPA